MPNTFMGWLEMDVNETLLVVLVGNGVMGKNLDFLMARN
jgi:hypothetical protein